uniref:Uncharacterized protein n=1 Tax=Mesocestoides corti TaxID=53468 RepID=A0A5K3FYL1_MESCO
MRLPIQRSNALESTQKSIRQEKKAPRATGPSLLAATLPSALKSRSPTASKVVNSGHRVFKAPGTPTAMSNGITNSIRTRSSASTSSTPNTQSTKGQRDDYVFLLSRRKGDLLSPRKRRYAAFRKHHPV